MENFKPLALFLIAALAVAMISCDKTAQKNAAVEKAATRVDSLFREWNVAESATVSADNGSMTINLTAGKYVHVDCLQQELFDFFLANNLKYVDFGTVDASIKALAGSKGKVSITINDSYGNVKTFEYTADRIRTLHSSKPLDFSRPIIKQQLCDMLLPIAPALDPAFYKDYQVRVSETQGFLTYTVTFKDDKQFAGKPQGVLTGIYFEPFKDIIASFSFATFNIGEFMRDLGLDGFRVVFTNEGGDKTLKQTFPWRHFKI